MLMAFELSMPGCGSWNGRWTGEGRPYVRVENITKKWDVKPGRHSYDFGDGWRASVTVRQVDGKTAAKLRRQSAGFCGYDWMINEIKNHGRILTLQERNAPNSAMDRNDLPNAPGQS
jgi:hypothetical protein